MKALPSTALTMLVLGLTATAHAVDGTVPRQAHATPFAAAPVTASAAPLLLAAEDAPRGTTGTTGTTGSNGSTGTTGTTGSNGTTGTTGTTGSNGSTGTTGTSGTDGGGTAPVAASVPNSLTPSAQLPGLNTSPPVGIASGVIGVGAAAATSGSTGTSGTTGTTGTTGTR